MCLLCRYQCKSPVENVNGQFVIEEVVLWGVGEIRRQWTSFVFGRVSSGGRVRAVKYQLRVYVEVNLTMLLYLEDV
jgi:hypothetical protein